MRRSMLVNTIELNAELVSFNPVEPHLRRLAPTHEYISDINTSAMFR